MRTLVLWFPDWPAQAALLDAPELARGVAIVAKHRVLVCDAAARRQGVRRGMRTREAQATYPQLIVLEDAPERDGRIFASIVDSLSEVAASIEVLRPGLAAIDVQAVAAYYGDEDTAAMLLADAANRIGVDSFLGIADDIPTAVIAARANQIVPPGQSAEFVASQAIGVLAAEPALGCNPDTVHLLQQLGIRTLGQLQQLPLRAVINRFGAAGLVCHEVASARQQRLVAPARSDAEICVAHQPEEPITRVDEAAFAARAMASSLHQMLVQRGLACQRLRIQAHIGERTLERVWRTTTALDERTTAERIRWQLDGWLQQGGQGAIDGLTLIPDCTAPEAAALPIAGVASPVDVASTPSGTGVPAAAQHAILRLQSTLGTQAVLCAVPTGGRGAQRVSLVPYGEYLPADGHMWVGALPKPLPSSLPPAHSAFPAHSVNSAHSATPAHPASQVRLLAADGTPVLVRDAQLSAAPTFMRWGRKQYEVTGWAGPWPVDEYWWQGGTPCARIQVTARNGEGAACAWLLLWIRGRWRIEASYQ